VQGGGVRRYTFDEFVETWSHLIKMIVVPTEKIKPGLILSEAVRDMNGRLLLARGHEIQAEHIRIFKMWGITDVTVEGNTCNDDQLEPEINLELMNEVHKTVNAIFSHTEPDHPAIKEIRRLAVQYRYKHHITDIADDMPIEEFTTSRHEHKVDLTAKLKKKKIVLPEIPSVVFELNEVIANPMSSADSIARVVNRSPSLTALLLKIVNSSFYGFPSKISRVSHAVTLIGTREISALALGISILSIFKNIPKEIIDMYSFLKHSLACGIASRILAAQSNFPQTEQLFVSGLLHDLGRLILYIYFPQESRNVLSRARSGCRLLYEEETDYLGCNHAEVGKMLMKQWKLPHILENNVWYHHRPSKAQQPIPAALVHLADIIVNSLGIGSSGEKFVPPLDHNAWENLELSPSCFENVVVQVSHQFASLESILHV